ncbi:hypothetical protein CTA1_1208 [Colletotrichum tanaceti]|uniref:Uncharacterized protein n=1 Tax=Colletotrichum tanaceti TaxID=1306861 RepID=A0A4V6DGU5_9PEZI|nr:hypothetical protein CTA1_1208 [Colletotrichum tanaceti]
MSFVDYLCKTRIRNHAGAQLDLLSAGALSLGLLGRARVPLLDAEEVVGGDGGEDVEEDKGPDDAKVAPALVVKDVAGGHVLVGVAEGAVLAAGGGVRVLQLAGGGGEVVGEVLAAGLVGGRVEDGGLGGGAGDGAAVQLGADDAGDPVGEGGDAVHEDPEAGQGGRGLQDAAEGQAHEHEQGDHAGGGLGVGEGGDGHVGEGAGVDEELDGEEQHQDLAGGGLDADDGVVEAGPDEEAGEDLVGDLDNDAGEHEGLPGVGLAGPLADLVEGALGDEVRLDLLDDGGEDGDDHEDGEDDVLHAGHAAVGLPEGEADEEAGGGAEEELGEDVAGHAPVLLEDADGDLGELRGEGHGELGVGAGGGGGVLFGLLLRRRSAAAPVLAPLLGVDPVNLGLDAGPLGARPPHGVPVLAPRVGAVVDDLEHVLGRVLVVAAGPGAVGLEVVEQGARVVANVAKVDGAAAAGEEQQAVELLEQDGAGLVDGAEHGLARVGELAQERADGPRALRVEPAGGLVEEQEQLGLGRQLDADGQELALLHVEALARHAHDGVGEVAHVEHVDDLLHEGVLLLAADGPGLAQHGAEPQALADGCRGHVEVYE